MKSSRCAFTLIELLVVIAIIGLLLALLLPAVANFSLPRNDRANTTAVAKPVELFQCPSHSGRSPTVRDPAPSGNGFLAGAGDYKTNEGGGSQIQSGVMFRNSRIRMDDMLDGAAQMILMGESSGRQSDGRWADAFHCCVHTQAALRSNPAYWTSEHSGVHFLFGDGSVRLLSDGVRPEVLVGLATRNGKEKIGAGDF